MILFLIHVVWLCQVPGEEVVWLPCPSLLSHIWVSVKCGFLVWMWRGLNNERLAHELFFLLWSAAGLW